MKGKILALIFMAVLFIFSVLNINMIGVSAYDSPAIYIEPASTADETLTVGSTYTISIKTDYNGSDIWGWQFTLDFNPELLQGGLNTTDTWTGNNVTTIFNATVTTVVPDSEKVYLDLALTSKIASGTDTWTGDGGTTLFVTTGKPVHEDSETVSMNFTDMWTGDNVNTTFTATRIPVTSASEEVYVDGGIMTRVALQVDTWTGDGVTKTFNTTKAPVLPDTERVLVGGEEMNKTAGDYTIDYATGNITFVTAPDAGLQVEAWYDYGDYTINYASGAITFVTAPGVGAEIKATYDAEMFRDTDYTIDYATGAITFVSAPSAGAKVEVTYQYGHYSINYQTGAITFRTAPGAGVEVKAVYFGNGIVNGGLITDVFPGTFLPGTFNNTAGKLSLTSGLFFYIFPPPPTTSGPGTLANVTFTVVGYNFSDIILGPDTELQGWDGSAIYIIIDGEATPNQLGHGYFRNLIPGDANGDGVVNIFDIGAISAHWYPGPPVGPLGYGREADLNLDGSVNIFDIGIASANWGNVAP